MRTIQPIRASQIPVEDANYVRVTLDQMWQELPALVVGSLLLALACALPLLLALAGLWLPAVLLVALATLPVWTAYCYLLGRNAAGFKPYLGDMLSAARHYYGRSCLLGIPALVLGTALGHLWPLLPPDPPLGVVAGLTVQALLLLGVAMLLVHALPLLALFDLTLGQVWSDSVVLVLAWPLAAIGLLSMLFLLTLAARPLSPGSWLVVPLIFVPFQVNATLMLVRKIMENRPERD
jgi:hypothetical protein